MKEITDKKKFWKIIKPLFSDKTKSAVSITLKDNNKIVESQNKVANIFNDYFSKIVSLLQILESNNIDLQSERMSYPTLKSIMEYRRHPSITTIQDAYKGSFSFSTVEKVDVTREIKNLSKKKAIKDDNTPVKILKENVNFFAEYICIFYNHAITTSKLPSFLKMANITPIFEKGSKNKKENFRPVSILPVLSKIFEKPMSKQLSTFFENILSKCQCGFRKGYSTQHCLLLMLEKWKLAVDNNEAFGALLTDLSKAFDCLNHDLLIAKLHSPRSPRLLTFSTSPRLLSDCLSNRKQRIKVENVFSKWQNIKTGVPQGSILGSLLFSTFVFDLFLILDNTYFVSYAVDNTPYTINQNTKFVTKSLKELSIPLLIWFKENKVKLNLDKLIVLIVSGTENAKIKLDDFTITNSEKEKLLGIIFDDKLSFQCRIENLC